jgi:hypothetical protein
MCTHKSGVACAQLGHGRLCTHSCSRRLCTHTGGLVHVHTHKSVPVVACAKVAAVNLPGGVGFLLAGWLLSTPGPSWCLASCSPGRWGPGGLHTGGLRLCVLGGCRYAPSALGLLCSCNMGIGSTAEYVAMGNVLSPRSQLHHTSMTSSRAVACGSCMRMVAAGEPLLRTWAPCKLLACLGAVVITLIRGC